MLSASAGTRHAAGLRCAPSTFPARTADMHNRPAITRMLEAELDQRGFVFVRGEQMRAWFEALGPLHDWSGFVQSWDDLHQDQWMADGGRYRRRRHAVFHADRAGMFHRQPHQPHWQSRDYNPLNGGIARWFAPVTRAVGESASLSTILHGFRRLCADLAPDIAHWRIEVHQFRIEAGPQGGATPTPEGLHRDGVDFVLVLMIGRDNIRAGTTAIHALDGRQLGRFTLAHAFDAAIVEDWRVFHGVTAVEPIDPSRPAKRDVLVVTFRRRHADPPESGSAGVSLS